MPTPPVSNDFAVKSIGEHTPGEGILVMLWTWGQTRTSVVYGGAFNGFFANTRHHFEYIPDLPGGPAIGITAVESGNRLFRGAPQSCVGETIVEYDGSTIINQWFRIGTTMDWSELPLILLDSTWVGAQTVTVESNAYDGTTANGQLIDADPELGDVTEITLTF